MCRSKPSATASQTEEKNQRAARGVNYESQLYVIFEWGGGARGNIIIISVVINVARIEASSLWSPIIHHAYITSDSFLRLITSSPSVPLFYTRASCCEHSATLCDVWTVSLQRRRDACSRREASFHLFVFSNILSPHALKIKVCDLFWDGLSSCLGGETADTSTGYSQFTCFVVCFWPPVLLRRSTDTFPFGRFPFNKMALRKSSVRDSFK